MLDYTVKYKKSKMLINHTKTICDLFTPYKAYPCIIVSKDKRSLIVVMLKAIKCPYWLSS